MAFQVLISSKLQSVITPSMDGYASNGAAMIFEGMKVTVAAGLPKAIVCDTDVLKNAPMEMIQAGYGEYDAVSKDMRYLCDFRNEGFAEK